MMKTTIFFCLISSFAMAQSNAVTVRSENGPNNTILIYAENQSYGSYSVRLMYQNLMGYSTTLSESSFAVVGHGSSQIAKLTRQENSTNFSFTYRYACASGKALNKTPDTNFIYLLPAMPSKKLTVMKARSLNQAIGKKEETTLYSLDFSFSLGDTICATRAGIVVELMDTVSVGEKRNQSYSQNRNSLIVEHKDGTTGRFVILSHVRSLVKLGDKVIPGQPIAIFDKANEKYELLFSVSYLDAKRFLSNEGSSIITLPVNWLFNDQQRGALGSEISVQAVTSVHSKEVIALELTKREKKKLGFE